MKNVTLRALAVLAMSAPIVACGSSTQPAGTTSSSSSGSSSSGSSSSGSSTSSGSSSSSGGTGGSASCTADQPGSTFTFMIHNAGTTNVSLTYGCGADLPIKLTTPAGTLGIGPGGADSCENSCAAFYANPSMSTTCSDCGNGQGAALAAGATVSIPWTRLVYTEITPDPKCVDGQSIHCAEGTSVAKSATQAGVLTVCEVDQGTSSSGFCSGSTKAVSFTVDTTGSSATIEVM